MNQQLVDSLFQVIQALSPEEQATLAQKLSDILSEPTSQETAHLVQAGTSFDFLETEPDLYTLDDGEPLL